MLPSNTNIEASIPESYHEELNQDDYPLVKYWNLQDWKDHVEAQKGISGGRKVKGGVLASQGINVAMLYVEDGLGEAIDGYAATHMRATAHRVFHQLLALGIAPLTWGTVQLAASKIYHREMVSEYPILRYCAKRWKADWLASRIYSSWYTTHRDSEKPVKSEDRDGVNGSSVLATKKRTHRRTSSPKSHRKKARAEEEAEASAKPIMYGFLRVTPVQLTHRVHD